MSKLERCCVGKKLDNPCYLLSYCSETGTYNFKDLDTDQQELLALRTGLEDISHICIHHLKVYIDKYTLYQKKCCDPFSGHKRVIKGRF